MNNDPLAIRIFEKKYRNGEESFDEWLDRVSAGNEEIKRLIVEKKFLFGGRILANRGVRDKHGCLNNCFVLPSPEDSIEGIYKTASEIARTFSYGGGVGINVSTLRPNGLPVHNAAGTTSGAVSFIDLYDTTADLISQGQRRGALMVCMDSSHPDIEEFVDLKSDLSKATKANTSVLADNEFMERALDAENPAYMTSFECNELGKSISKPIDANELFDKIAQRNWETAEPGMLFYDNINKSHILSEYDEIDIRCPNPCATGDTKILTDEGYIEIGSLAGQTVNIWNGYEFSEVEIKKTGENTPINLIRFSNGVELKCTLYHKFILSDGQRVECSDVNVGDTLIKHKLPVIQSGIELKAPYTQGFYSGDGTYDSNKRIKYIDFWDIKQDCIAKCENETNVIRYKPSNNGRIVRCNVDVPFGKQFVPLSGYDVNSRIRWFEGLCDADGSITKDGLIAITSVNRAFLTDVFLMLQTLGIDCTCKLCKPAEQKLFPEQCGGKIYQTKDLYRLCVNNANVRALQTLGFNPVRCKNGHIGKRSIERSVSIVSIEPAGKSDVFCFNEPKNHSGMFNGVITANCGEIPMEPGSACLLSSFNLSEYVNDDGKFDEIEFARDVRTVVIAMEKLQEESIPLLPLEIQKVQAKRWKRIGVGIMGLADMLIKMGITYGSKESLAVCDAIGERMAHEALRTSEAFGLKYGSFEGFDEEKINGSAYVQRHIDHVRALRNGSLLTIAPTGSLSTMLGVSGGIEPLFDTIYTRKTESLDGEDTYYQVHAPIVQKYMDDHGVTDESDLPPFIVTAKEISWSDRIRMQAVWQQHIDQAISSTVNLKESITADEIKLLYERAWRSGLKGVTVYRENCQRTGILQSKSKSDSTLDTSSESKSAETPCLDGEIKAIITPLDPIGKKRKLMTGCVDCDTEYFNGTEWKKISTYTDGDSVLQYNPDGTANLVKPLSYIKRRSEKNYHILTKYGLDMVVSHDHRNVLFDKRTGNYDILTTNELIDSHNNKKHGEYRKFKLSFDYSGDGIDLSDEEIRLSIAVFADGSFHGTSFIGDKCTISVKKQRKCERLASLLTNLGLEYDETVNNKGYHSFKFYPPLVKTKHFPKEWYNCSKHQMEVIFDEVFRWDGNSSVHNEYTTIHKEDADFIQFVCASLGHRASLYTDTRCNRIAERKNHSVSYRVDHSVRNFAGITRGGEKLTIGEYTGGDGYDYCFTVPSSMLILRRNDRIFVTGNCGPLHCVGFFDRDNGRLMEVYLGKGSQGGCNNYMNGLARMISLSARAGLNIYDIADQLDSTGVCPSYAVRRAVHKDTSKGSCCPMAIGNALIEMYLEMQDEIDHGMYWECVDDDIDAAIEESQECFPDELNDCDSCIELTEDANLEPESAGVICEWCGAIIPMQTEGCWSCKLCGWSRCG